ncbi:MAG: circularly permuted type 2 ATP-grasp protein [Planctomycetota bacterium]
MQTQRQSASGQAAGGQSQSGTPVANWLAEAHRQALSARSVEPTGGPGAYDELLDGSGQLRNRWRTLGAQLQRIGEAEVRRRWTQAQRLIYDNGVAYGHDQGEGPDGRPRPWALDPAPLLITPPEWQTITVGLEQRARLLEAILQDLYGPQELLRSGVLPPEVLFDHPGYLLPLRRTDGEAARRMLTFYAADLGRAPNGDWWVMADRTEAPSGVGFALENRIVVSRMLPEPFRECRVRRLAGYFVQLRETLEQVSPEGQHNPRIAILSQGPGQKNYFEDAYLARYLGFTLVEGEDLTVRNRKLWLKTLEGLAPIDLLIRRPNSSLCDPLELGGQSPSGVAGVIQAQRDGRLGLANSLGSGLVESPVFMAFLPRLCQHVMGESLKLPGVATYWCGEKDSLELVLNNLDNMVLKRAYRQRGRESLLIADLRRESPEKLAQRIRDNPRAFVAQERINRSTTPIYRDGDVAAGKVAIRAFAVAAGESYRVMDGALARTTSSDEPLETSLLSGEGSKDVWVLSDEPVEPITLLDDDDASVELVRVGPELPSRVADHSFWLGRRLERADFKARLARTVAYRLTSEGGPEELKELPPLLRALAEQGQIEPGYAVEELRNLLPHVDISLPTQVLSPSQAGSLYSTIARVFNNAAQVRDRLSRDAWRVLLRLRETLPDISKRPTDLTDLINAIDELVVMLSAISGMVIESMTRTQFYRFLDIGRRLERAMQLTDLLRTSLVESQRTTKPLLEALLETTDSLMTYRSRYRANMRFAAVLDLLMTDQSNPRSLAFQLQTLERHMGKLPRGPEDPPGAAAEERLAMSMAHAVRMTDIAQIADAYEIGQHEPLAALLDKLSEELPKLSDALSLKYLVHAGAPRQLAPM